MDIVQVSSSSLASEYFEESESEMSLSASLRGAQIQGDYSGYVPPEVLISSDNSGAPTRKTSASRPPSRGGIRPLSPTEVPVQVRGNLQKMGKRLKGWHSRYFEIQGEHMYYYKTHMKKECMGEIQLRNCYFCDATTVATFGHPFEIRTTNRSHIFAARTNDEMVQWVRVIRKNMGTSEQEAAVRKSAKPKRWESFKQALAIKPGNTSTPDKSEPKKKQNRKLLGKKLRIRKDSKEKSPIHSTKVSLNESHPPPIDDTRPISLTEDEIGRDTLEILAALQPTRSLPATPLTVKRPVNFDDPPDSPSFLRETTGSPALTLDSTLSTPGTSTQVSPAHTALCEVEVSMEDTTSSVKEPTVENGLEEVLAEESLASINEVVENGDAMLEESLAEESAQNTPQAEVEEVIMGDTEIATPVPVVETQTVELVEQVEAVVQNELSELDTVEPVEQNGVPDTVGPVEQNGVPDTVGPVEQNRVPDTVEATVQNGPPEPVEATEQSGLSEPEGTPVTSSESTLPNGPTDEVQVQPEPVLQEKVPEIVEPIKQEPPLTLSPEEDKEYTWDKIRELVQPADHEEDKSYSMLPPLDTPWLSHDTAIEQLRAFLLTCP